MIFGWIHVVLIFCWSSASFQTDNNEEVQTVCVPENATVHVPCPPSDWSTKEFIFYLYRWHVEVQQHKLNATEKRSAPTPDGGLREVRFNPHNGSFELVAQKKMVGGYTCVAEQVYPPPSQKTSSRPLLVLLKGQHQHSLTSASCNEPPVEKVCDETTSDVQLWALGLGMTTTLGLVSTIVAVVFWFRLKSAESYHNDYINTKSKPRGPQGRNRGGVQHPAPKRF